MEEDLKWLPLRSSHIQRKIIYNRAKSGSLRAARLCIFTGGVVKANGSCRACFLRKRLRGGKVFCWLNSLSQNRPVLPAPSEREPLARPQTLRLSRKLYRYAKGPILEGAGIA